MTNEIQETMPAQNKQAPASISEAIRDNTKLNYLMRELSKMTVPILEACKIKDVSRTSIYNAIDRGELTPVIVHNVTIGVTKQSLEAYKPIDNVNIKTASKNRKSNKTTARTKHKVKK